MPAHSVEELAAQLGRPPSALAGLRTLTPQEIAVLSEAIDEASERAHARLPVLVAALLRWQR